MHLKINSIDMFYTLDVVLRLFFQPIQKDFNRQYLFCQKMIKRTLL